MTRRIRLWITAVLSVAATALMVNHAHTHPPLAGLTAFPVD
jgi:hypothetical protein